MSLRPVVLLILVLVMSAEAEKGYNVPCKEGEDECKEDMECKIVRPDEGLRCQPGSYYQICRPAFKNPGDPHFGVCVMCHTRPWMSNKCDNYGMVWSHKELEVVEGVYENKLVCKLCLDKNTHGSINGSFTVIGYDGENTNKNQRMLVNIAANFYNDSGYFIYDFANDYGRPGMGWGGSGAESLVQMYSPLAVIVMAATVAYQNVAG